jgi:hypothetical protein
MSIHYVNNTLIIIFFHPEQDFNYAVISISGTLKCVVLKTFSSDREKVGDRPHFHLELLDLWTSSIAWYSKKLENTAFQEMDLFLTSYEGGYVCPVESH